MDPVRLARLMALIEAGQEHAFYLWGPWRRLRAKVLEMDHKECQVCAARGKYSRAEIVHHVKTVRERPDLALSVIDPETGERQLIAVCKRCHEEAHPEALRAAARNAAFSTVERWD